MLNACMCNGSRLKESSKELRKRSPCMHALLALCVLLVMYLSCRGLISKRAEYFAHLWLQVHPNWCHYQYCTFQHQLLIGSGRCFVSTCIGTLSMLVPQEGCGCVNCLPQTCYYPCFLYICYERLAVPEITFSVLIHVYPCMVMCNSSCT